MSSSTPVSPRSSRPRPGRSATSRSATPRSRVHQRRPEERGQAHTFCPRPSTIGQAGAQATHLSASNFSIIDEPGLSTYPFANFSWTLLYQKQANAAKGTALGKLFDWVVTTGQQQAKSLGYSPLPANVAQLAKTTLAKLQS